MLKSMLIFPANHSTCCNSEASKTVVPWS